MVKTHHPVHFYFCPTNISWMFTVCQEMAGPTEPFIHKAPRERHSTLNREGRVNNLLIGLEFLSLGSLPPPLPSWED